MKPLITRETVLPVADLGPLVTDAGREGHSFVMRALREWTDGDNRFLGRGEAFYVAWRSGSLVGIAGRSATSAPEIARLRHLFVRPDSRRKGVARELVARIRSDGLRVFQTLIAQSTDKNASAALERLGFQRVIGDRDATHSITTKGRD